MSNILSIINQQNHHILSSSPNSEERYAIEEITTIAHLLAVA